MISVIVPVYNVENYLTQCIDSIIGQSYIDLEIILIDDGSTDSSGKICDEYALKDKRIKVIHQNNQGPSVARNRGLEEAEGDWISFIDSDDWIDREMYQKMMESLDKYKADIVLCKHVEVSEQNHIAKIDAGSIHFFEGYELIKAYIQKNKNYLITTSVWDRLYKRELIIDLRFPESMMSEEICFSIQVFCNSKKAIYLDEQLYNYRVNRAGSITSSNYTVKRIEDEIFLTEQAIRYLKERGLRELAKELYVNLYLDLSSIYIHSSDKEVRSYIRKYRKNVKHGINEIIRKNNMSLKKQVFLIIDRISPKLRMEIIRLYTGVKNRGYGN